MYYLSYFDNAFNRRKFVVFKFKYNYEKDICH